MRLMGNFPLPVWNILFDLSLRQKKNVISASMMPGLLNYNISLSIKPLNVQICVF